MRSLLLIFLLFLCLSGFAQKGNPNESKWHARENISNTEYAAIKKSGISYFLSNDNDNLYLELKIEGIDVQNMIIHQGLVLWIDMEGKLRRKLGVRYPIGSQKKLSHSKASQPELATNPDGSPGSPLSMANTIELIGFIGEQVRHFASENPDNFSGSVKYDNNGVLYYKMRLPIAKLPLRNKKEGNGAMPFALGLEYGFKPEAGNQGAAANQPPASYNKKSVSRGSGRPVPGRPGRGEKISDENVGRNAKTNEYESGSELLWIKDIKLAASK
jgi:hypothetical protein